MEAVIVISTGIGILFWGAIYYSWRWFEYKMWVEPILELLTYALVRVAEAFDRLAEALRQAEFARQMAFRGKFKSGGVVHGGDEADRPEAIIPIPKKRHLPRF